MLRRLWARAAPALLCVGLGAGCGLAGSPTEPLVIAHRAAAGYFPENSRRAIHGSIERDFPGIEFDLVLTKDAVPVLSHDPWIDHELCTRVDGEAIPETPRTLLRDLTLEELQRDYRCGGVPDPAQPDAEVVEETHATLDEVLTAVAAAPEMTIHLDVKFDPATTLDAETYAREILGRWRAANLPNPVYASADLPDLLRAFRQEMPEMETTLIWPRFSSEESNVVTAVSNETRVSLGMQSLSGRIVDAEADGIAIAWQVIDRHAVERLRDEGFKVQVWTVNQADLQKRFCAWPIDALITDYPEEAPCIR